MKNIFYRNGYIIKSNKKKNEISIRFSVAEYLTYVAAVGDDKDSIEVRYEDENLWMTQEQISKLFDKAKSTINEHIKNIYDENELKEESTMRKFRISEFSTKPTHYYNLEMITKRISYKRI